MEVERERVMDQTQQEGRNSRGGVTDWRSDTWGQPVETGMAVEVIWRSLRSD